MSLPPSCVLISRVVPAAAVSIRARATRIRTEMCIRDSGKTAPPRRPRFAFSEVGILTEDIARADMHR